MTAADHEPPVSARPPRHLTRLQMRLLDAYIGESIDDGDFGDDLRSTLHNLRLDGRLKVTSVFSPAEPVPELFFLVSVPGPDGEWAPLVELHWSCLAITTEQYEEEMRLALLLNGRGIPDDPSALGD